MIVGPSGNSKPSDLESANLPKGDAGKRTQNETHNTFRHVTTDSHSSTTCYDKLPTVIRHFHLFAHVAELAMNCHQNAIRSQDAPRQFYNKLRQTLYEKFQQNFGHPVFGISPSGNELTIGFADPFLRPLVHNFLAKKGLKIGARMFTPHPSAISL